MLKLDHVAFGAADLGRGIEIMSGLLGAEPVGGGRHELFGTHNALWRLETRDVPIYLEVIAVDPDAPPPARRRWFGLDDGDVQARLGDGVKLVSLVASTPDIAADCRDMPEDPGTPIEVRRGDLVWQFSLPDDGRLIAAGTLPYLIEWPPGPRPVDAMPGQNIGLVSVGGARLAELDMGWPCPVRAVDSILEVELMSAHGKPVLFSA